eukprot:4919104-Amphidinium_carterae.2
MVCFVFRDIQEGWTPSHTTLRCKDGMLKPAAETAEVSSKSWPCHKVRHALASGMLMFMPLMTHARRKGTTNGIPHCKAG